MSMFLITFILIYGAMHAVFLFGVKAVIPSGKLSCWILFTAAIFLIFAPVISRMLEHSGRETAAVVTGYIAYYWMGFLLIALTPSFLASIYHIVIFLVKRFSGSETGDPAAGFIAWAILFISFWLSVWAVFEASNIRIEHLTVQTEKLDHNTGRIRIVMISDVHLGLLSDESKIKRMVEQIRTLHPDIFVNAGDFIDGSASHVQSLARMFREIDVSIGKYGVLGNHEFYRGASRSVEKFQNAGFEALRDEKQSLTGNVVLIGEDDSHHENKGPVQPLFDDIPENSFVILIKHRPEVDQRLVGRFDLQLSGHSHGGQIFPFTIPVHMKYEYARGFHDLGRGSYIYTSRGTGVWGPPMRLGAPPEITVIDLIKTPSEPRKQ